MQTQAMQAKQTTRGQVLSPGARQQYVVTSVAAELQKGGLATIDQSFVLTSTPLRSCRRDVPTLPGAQLYAEEIDGRRRLVYEVEPTSEVSAF